MRTTFHYFLLDRTPAGLRTPYEGNQPSWALQERLQELIEQCLLEHLCGDLLGTYTVAPAFHSASQL